MKFVTHVSNTRVLSRPPGTPEEDCGELGITDVVCRDPSGATSPNVISFWEPSQAEKEAIMRGVPVQLWVQGRTHPPLTICVGTAPNTVIPDTEEGK